MGIIISFVDDDVADGKRWLGHVDLLLPYFQAWFLYRANYFELLPVAAYATAQTTYVT